jgi:heat shock protein HslJ
MKKTLPALLACTTSLLTYAQTKQATIQVHPQNVPCTNVATTTCLQIRYHEQEPWQRLHGGIRGFQHQTGFLYTLAIKETRVSRPTADGSSLQRTLVKIIRKMPAWMDKQLFENTWTISHLRKNGKWQSVLPGGYTLLFNDSSVTAKVCNQFRGRFVAAADGIVKTGPLVSTRMACPQAADEAAFSAAIHAVYSLVVKNNSLTLYNRQGQPVLKAMAGQPAPAAVEAPANIDYIDYQALLDASRYLVTSLTHDAGTTDVSEVNAFLQFDRAKKQVSGNGGCNNFFGSAEMTFSNANSGTLSLGNMGSTMMACPQHMDTERRLFQLLGKVDGFEMTSTGLLLKKDGKILVQLVSAR